MAHTRSFQKNTHACCLLLAFVFTLAPLAFALDTPPAHSCFIYPSPATGLSAKAVFNMTQSGTAQIRIYNEAGDLVFETEEVESTGIQQAALDLSFYRNGLYLCQIKLLFDGGGMDILDTFKFVVAR